MTHRTIFFVFVANLNWAAGFHPLDLLVLVYGLFTLVAAGIVEWRFSREGEK